MSANKCPSFESWCALVVSWKSFFDCVFQNALSRFREYCRLSIRASNTENFLSAKWSLNLSSKIFTPHGLLAHNIFFCLCISVLDKMHTNHVCVRHIHNSLFSNVIASMNDYSNLCKAHSWNHFCVYYLQDFKVQGKFKRFLYTIYTFLINSQQRSRFMIDLKRFSKNPLMFMSWFRIHL